MSALDGPGDLGRKSIRIQFWVNIVSARQKNPTRLSNRFAHIPGVRLTGKYPRHATGRRNRQRVIHGQADRVIAELRAFVVGAGRDEDDGLGRHKSGTRSGTKEATIPSAIASAECANRSRAGQNSASGKLSRIIFSTRSISSGRTSRRCARRRTPSKSSSQSSSGG